MGDAEVMRGAMKKTTIFENIGFGKYGDAEIRIEEDFSPSNDFEGCYIEVNGVSVTCSDSTRGAIEQALDPETAEWIVKQMR